jgi:hypothetical protein
MKVDPAIPIKQYFSRYAINGMVSFRSPADAKGRGLKWLTLLRCPVGALRRGIRPLLHRKPLVALQGRLAQLLGWNSRRASVPLSKPRSGS